MSWRMLTFRCEAGHEFEDLADENATSVPCATCAQPAARQKVIEAPSIRGGGRLSTGEKKQALAQFGPEVYDFKRKAWKIDSKSDLNKILKKKGMVAVDAKNFDKMLEQHQSIIEREETREATPQEKEQRRAELMPAVKSAKEIVRSNPRTSIARDQSNIPTEVRQVIPDAAKAATGVEDKV